MTQTGTVLGTGEYLAPEQASGKPVSPATDVYSLGVVLWELLAGDVPFAGENFVAVALRHVNEPPPDLRERRPDVSPRLDAAVAARAGEGSGAAASRRWRRSPTSCAPASPSPRSAGARVRGRRRRTRSSRASRSAPARPPARAGARSRRRAARLRAAGASSSPALRSRPSCCSAARATTAAAAWRRRLVGHAGAAARRRRRYDPQGDGQEHNDAAPASATDGSRGDLVVRRRPTASQTFGGLKSGVGLVLDAGSPVKLAHLTVTTPTPGFTAEIQVRRLAVRRLHRSTRPRRPSTGTTTFDARTARRRSTTSSGSRSCPPAVRAEISEVTAKS